MHKCQNKFANQYSIKVSTNSKKWNCKENKTDTDTQSYDAMDETGNGFSKPVQNTGQHGIQV